MGMSINDLIRLMETILRCKPEKDGDHIRYTLKVNDKIIGKLKYSHSWRGNQQLDDSILHLQAKSMNCTNKTWKLLLQGQLTKDDYFAELLARNIINQSEFDILCKKKNLK
jgi:hypothetical protein